MSINGKFSELLCSHVEELYVIKKAEVDLYVLIWKNTHMYEVQKGCI